MSFPEVQVFSVFGSLIVISEALRGMRFFLSKDHEKKRGLAPASRRTETFNCWWTAKASPRTSSPRRRREAAARKRGAAAEPREGPHPGSGWRTRALLGSRVRRGQLCSALRMWRPLGL